MSKNHNPKHRHSPKAKNKIDPKYIKSAQGYLYLKEEVLQDLHFIQQHIGSKKTKDFTVTDIERFLKKAYNAEKITVEQVNESFLPKWQYPFLTVASITEDYVHDEYCVGIYRINYNRPIRLNECESRHTILFIGSTDGIHCEYAHDFMLGGHGLKLATKLRILCNCFPDLE